MISFEVKQRKLAHLAHRILHLGSLKATTSKEQMAKYLTDLQRNWERNRRI